MRRSLAALSVAVGFLTVIPVRTDSVEPRTVGRSLIWFPVVGLLIGFLLAAVDLLAADVFTRGVTVALVLTTGAMLTGAIHLDGLADSADGVFGGRTPARRLEIMRDSRIGSYGVVALILALLLQLAALDALGETDRLRALLLVPALARGGMVLAITSFPYVRPEGLGRTFKDHASRADLVFVSVVTLLASLLILRGAGLLLWVTAVVVTLAAGWFFSRRLGGLTGDTYGAIAVIDEVVLFLVLAAMRPE